MAVSGSGTIGDIFFSNTEIYQDRFVSAHRHNNIRWLNIAMHNRCILTMQVAHSGYNRVEQSQQQGQRKPLIWLLCAQDLHVRSIDITHKDIDTSELTVFKYAIDLRQSGVIKFLQHLPLKNEAFTLTLIGIDNFFKCKYPLPIATLSNAVDGTKATSTKEIFYSIAVAIRVSYNISLWQCYLFLQHDFPHVFITRPTHPLYTIDICIHKLRHNVF